MNFISDSNLTGYKQLVNMKRISDHGLLSPKCDINIILFPSFLRYNKWGSWNSKRCKTWKNDRPLYPRTKNSCGCLYKTYTTRSSQSTFSMVVGLVNCARKLSKELLATDGCWSRKSEFFSGVWSLVVSPCFSGSCYTHDHVSTLS